MNFIELRETIGNSDASEWRRIERQGPTYRDRFGSWSSPSEGTSGVDTDSHTTIAVYQPDIDLTIAYGMAERMHPAQDELSLEWSNNFADSTIREINLIDVFWRGSLVDRLQYAHVDGPRAILPIGDGHQGLRITRYEYSVVRLLSDIEVYDEFETYFAAVPFEFKD